MSDSDTNHTAPTEADDENVVKRRSKNRVNARRSRERKRLLLDALQQEHFQLHQENKRIKMENQNLRESILLMKSLTNNNTIGIDKDSLSSSATMSQVPSSSIPGMFPAQANQIPSQARNQLVELLTQQILLKQQPNMNTASLNHQIFTPGITNPLLAVGANLGTFAGGGFLNHVPNPNMLALLQGMGQLPAFLAGNNPMGHGLSQFPQTAFPAASPASRDVREQQA